MSALMLGRAAMAQDLFAISDLTLASWAPELATQLGLAGLEELSPSARRRAVRSALLVRASSLTIVRK